MKSSLRNIITALVVVTAGTWAIAARADTYSLTVQWTSAQGIQETRTVDVTPTGPNGQFTLGDFNHAADNLCLENCTRGANEAISNWIHDAREKVAAVMHTSGGVAGFSSTEILTAAGLAAALAAASGGGAVTTTHH